MNWNAQGLTTVNKERIWKEYVSKESDKRVIYDEFRQRVTEKSRDPEVKISPRGKRFIAKEPYGIKMEMNNATGRYTPVLTDKVLAGPALSSSHPRSNTSPVKSSYNSSESSPQESHSSPHKRQTKHSRAYATDSTKDTTTGSHPTSPTAPTAGSVKLPAIPLSPSALAKQRLNNLQNDMSSNGNSPSNNVHVVKSPGAAAASSNSRFNNSPRRNQSSLQQQYMQNTFSNSHGGAEDPLDRALKNLQFLSTTNATIGRGTVELLQSPTSPTNRRTSGTPTGAEPNANEFGDTLSGSLRATYQATSSPLKVRNDPIPGSPRSYVVKDESGGSLFDYSRKQCDITKTHQELSLRK